MDEPPGTPPRAPSRGSAGSPARDVAASPNLLEPSPPGSPLRSWHEVHGAARTASDASDASNDSEVTVNYDAESGSAHALPWRLTTFAAVADDSSGSTRPRTSQSDGAPHAAADESSSSASLPAHREHDGEGPPAKVRRLSTPRLDDDADGETCPICLEPWGNSGAHRLVALKCGHLFGAQCVERWLKAQTSRDRSCPTCKSKATLKDIRFIYAKRLVSVDTSQVTALQKQVELLQTEKSRVELELQKCKIAHRACVLQLEVVRSTLMKSQVSKEQPARRNWRFALEKNLEVCKDGGCRVLTYNCRTYELYVSQKSANRLFPGYGFRKVSCVDYRPGQFVHLHPKPVRDMTYSQPRDLLLSVALDGSARVVERGAPTLTVQCGMPLWSCSWDHLRSHEFYVGGVGGVVQQYDVRNPGVHVQRLSAPGDVSPVVSLCSTEFGLLSCQLNSCWLWTAGVGQWGPRALPAEGPFMSLTYDAESHRALVACRAGTGVAERARLALCRLRPGAPGAEVQLEAEQSFAGSARSTLMSRAAWVRAAGATWVAAHSESDGALQLHGLDGARGASLPAAEPALDVRALQLHADTLLAALSATRLRIYKALATGT